MSIGSSKATQPVSATSLPLPAGAAQDGADISAPTAMPAGGSGLRGWLSAIWTKLNGSLAVTGTFFQATQPVSIAATVAVSGPATDTQLRATPLPVSGTVTANTGLTQPLTDTQVRASALPVSGPLTDTQLRAAAVPMSLAALPALVAGAAIVGKVGIDQTTPGTTNLVQVGGSLPAGTNKVGTVDIATAAAVAKGTQGANGVPTQDLKDSGRSARTITLDSFAVAATAETLMTMSYSTDNGALVTGSSYNVTAGKRFRVTAIMASLHTIAGNTTAVGVIVRLRANNGGAALVGSPVQAVLPIQGVAAANQAGFPTFMDVPDGWEFVAGAGIGVTVACPGFVATTAAPKVDITIIGYEY